MIEKNRTYSEPIDKGIMNFQFHPNILLVKTDDIDKEICTLNAKKAHTQNDIPTKILKKCASSTASILQKLLNDTLRIENYPGKLKLAGLTPVFKQNNPVCLLVFSLYYQESLKG